MYRRGHVCTVITRWWVDWASHVSEVPCVIAGTCFDLRILDPNFQGNIEENRTYYLHDGLEGKI